MDAVAPRDPRRAPPGWRLFFSVGLLLALAIPLAGLLIYGPRAETDARRKAVADLQLRADLRSATLHRWIAKGAADAALVASYPSVQSLAHGLAPEATITHLIETLRAFTRIEEYDQVVVLRGGQTLAGAVPTPLTPACLDDIGGRPVDMHRHPDGHVVARFSAAVDGVPDTWIVLEQQADSYLFPLMRRDVLPYNSGAGLLLEHRGSTVRYLSPLKFAARALPGVVPPSDRAAALPEADDAAAAVRDYRGIPVLCAVRRLEGVPWTIVMKADETELLGAARAEIRTSVTAWTALGAAALFAGATALLWRRRYAGSLARSEAHLGVVLEHASDPILFTTVDGTILDANPRAYEFYRYPPGTLAGLRVGTNLEVTADADAWRLDHSPAPRAANLLYEARHRRRDGTIVSVEVHVGRFDLQGEPRLIAVVRDLSERLATRRREERVNQMLRVRARINQQLSTGDSPGEMLEEACRTATEGPGVRLAWVGFTDPDGSIRLAARAGEASAYMDEITIRWKGGPLADGPGGRAIRERRTVAGVIEDSMFEPWRQAAIRWGIRTTTAVPILKGGQVVGVLSVYGSEPESFDAEGVRLLEGVASDLGFALQTIDDRAARRQHEQALLASEARFRAIFDQSPIGIALGRLDGRIDRMNPALERMLGYSEAEMRQISFRDITPASDLEREEPLFARLGAGEVESYYLEKRYIRKDGRVVWGELTVTVVRDASGQSAFRLALVRDITERKMLQEQLLQSQKMEGIGRLAGGIAHDFNNLLTAILGYGEVLATELPAMHPGQAFVAEIQKAGMRAASLTSQLLAFARRQVVAPRVLDLNDVVADAERLLRRLIGDHVQIVTARATSLWAVEADPNQLQQILVNMVVNARDALPEGGVIRVGTDNITLEDGDPRLAGQEAASDYVCLTVADNGTGMSPEVQAHIFEPFFTTKEQGKGTGLGLATCHGIVTQNGGFIRVASQLGQGTTFAIFLPRADRALQAQPPVVSPPADSGRGEVVLVAEGEQAVRMLAVRSLAARGYEVLAAADAESAVALMDANRGRIDLLVSDAGLPRVGDATLTEHFTRAYPGMPVLVLSGTADAAAGAESSTVPALDYLLKPFGADAITRRVRRILDNRAAAAPLTGTAPDGLE